MTLPGGIKVCVFDAYGTLLDLGAMVERIRADLGDAAEPFFKAWRRKQLEISWLPNPIIAGADFWLVTGEALDETMVKFGITDSGLRARLMDGWLAPALYPEVPAMLARLRSAGFTAAILSNGTRKMLAAGVDAAGIAPLLDAVLSVEDVRVFKPNPAVYKLAADYFSVDPRSVCFVSGNIWDIHAAAAFGFNVVWINRAGVPPENRPRGTAATTITLAELPALLGA
ncbi:MAG: haloacid dehalogenase type II [Magnetospirillum sp.]|nr:MAG: haloacid dehalogenase type II [Magnetospirillum sp.]